MGRFNTLTLAMALLMAVLLHLKALGGQLSKEEQGRIITVSRIFQKYHVQPLAINDELSGRIFNLLLKDVDPNHVYFTQAEYNALAKFEFTLDDELNGHHFEFLEAFRLIYEHSLRRADSIITKTMAQPFDLKKQEYLALQEERATYAKDEKDLAERWYRRLKWNTIQMLSQKAKDTTKPDLAEKNEEKFRKKVETTLHRRIENNLSTDQGFQQVCLNLYCKALSLAFDPHSEYMAPIEKERFVGMMSSEELAFGLELTENEKGEIVIEQLTPGGPAWKSGELHNNDVIVKLKWDKENAIDLYGATLSEVENILDKYKNEFLEVTVVAENGERKTVRLKKTKLRNDETIVKSYILKGEKRIGYIVLPSFYTQWENTTGSSCANDLAKEVVKLMKDSIDGLILDLRYNGGGSLQEAMELTGIFIQEGAVALEKLNEGKPMVLKDPNRGTIYDGPLLVMVNGETASASEVVAGALQDYNRAIIVGTKTYGKATGQVILPADSLFDMSNANLSRRARNKMNKGFVKITIEKLYRPTGFSNQINGIKPDIWLPDLYDSLTFREGSNDYALHAEPIKRAVYFTPLPPINTGGLADKSGGRVSGSEQFTALKACAGIMPHLDARNIKQVPLALKDYEHFLSEDEQQLEKLKKTLEGKKTSHYEVKNNDFNQAIVDNDPFEKEINSKGIANIEKSSYIEECYLILTDYINQQK